MADYKELIEDLRDRHNEDRYKTLSLDAAAAIEALQDEVDTLKRTDYKRCQECLYLGQPVGEQQIPKRGEWILQASGQDCKCSVCESYWIPFGDEYDYKFCPNCGAVMEGQE